jgi:RNA 3'-terminal phosphate cyclase (ATP)
MELLTIDGALGEGGGQVLRTSLGLALALGRPVRVTNVRAGRAKPGLLRQHLAAVRAACAVSGGECAGAELGSREVRFEPGKVRAGSYTFSIGSAGSTTLVLETILPALMLADGPSTLVLEGGTHNPLAPPFGFLARSFAPVLAQCGPRLELALECPGFHPAGGGRLTARIEPVSDPQALTLLERGSPIARRCEIGLAHLSPEIAEREWAVVQKGLALADADRVSSDWSASAGPGNFVALELEFAHVTEVVTAFGERRLSAERVARSAVDAAQRYLAAEAPVGEHLADQLMVPLALLAGGTYRTLEPTLHTRTNAEVVNRFLRDAVKLESTSNAACLVGVERGLGGRSP